MIYKKQLKSSSRLLSLATSLSSDRARGVRLTLIRAKLDASSLWNELPSSITRPKPSLTLKSNKPGSTDHSLIYHDHTPPEEADY